VFQIIDTNFSLYFFAFKIQKKGDKMCRLFSNMNLNLQNRNINPFLAFICRIDFNSVKNFVTFVKQNVIVVLKSTTRSKSIPIFGIFLEPADSKLL
jgi:hypothetical protein